RDVVILGGLAGRNERVIAHLVRRRKLNARQEGDRGKVVAIHRGQLAQLVGADVAPHFGARRVDQRRLRGYAYRFFEGADDHRDVDRQRLADRQDEAATLEVLEAGQLGGDAVSAGNQLRREIRPVSTADDFAKDARPFIGDDDSDPGQDAALLVGDVSADF